MILQRSVGGTRERRNVETNGKDDRSTSKGTVVRSLLTAGHDNVHDNDQDEDEDDDDDDDDNNDNDNDHDYHEEEEEKDED